MTYALLMFVIGQLNELSTKAGLNQQFRGAIGDAIISLQRLAKFF